jgi:lipopolysaccharide/colanic/teichoic acid biosynthesis glycosyltransferase
MDRRRRDTVRGRIYARVKRAMDMAIALAAMVVTAPLLAVIAIAIRLEDRGPAILRQSRVGLDGEDFELLKFRTMVADAHRIGAGWLVADRDPRITRVGRVLRKWSLDELPQMFNVLRGDMSIVGPRPTLRYQVDQYTPFQRRRLAVRPGITGWAQVNGRNALPWKARIELDVWYVDHLGLVTDLRILLRTIPLVVRPAGVYNEARADWGERVDPAGHADVAPEAPAETTI